MKNNLVAAIIISVSLGLAGGYLIGDSSSSDSKTSHSESKEHSDDHGTHSHGETFMVDANQAPTVKLTAEEDKKSGWNISLKTTMFKFSPESVNLDNVVGEGHAHLYVDGEKVARLYGPNFHYDGSFDGTKTFKVTLNANDHSEYAVEGKVISDEVKVTHDHSKEDNHSHSN